MSAPERRLHIATIVVAFLENLRPLVVPALVVIFAGGRPDGDNWEQVVGGALAALAVIPAVARYVTFRFTIDDRTLEIRSGWIMRQRRTIPLERIQNVNVKRNVLHRLLKVAVLDIETAGGMGSEASLSVVADADVDALVAELRGGIAGVSEPLTHEGPPPVYQATVRQLMVAGATENRALALIFVILGVGNEFIFDRIGNMVEKSDTVRFLAVIPPAVLYGVLIGGFLFLAILAGWAYSIGSQVVSNFGFRLTQRDGVITVERGLLTQRRSVVPLRRIQLLRISEPVLQRKLGYAQVFSSSAAAFDDKDAGGQLALCPIIERESVDDLLSLSLPGARLHPDGWEPLGRGAWTLFWLASIWVIVALSVIPMTLMSIASDDLRRSLSIAGGIFGGYVLLSAGLNALKVRSFGFQRSDGFFQLRSGWWRKDTAFVPEDRIQTVTLHQSPGQRKRGLATVTVTTAAAVAGTINLPHIPVDRARELVHELAARSAQLSGGV